MRKLLSFFVSEIKDNEAVVYFEINATSFKEVRRKIIVLGEEVIEIYHLIDRICEFEIFGHTVLLIKIKNGCAITVRKFGGDCEKVLKLMNMLEV